jgi:hypothetical protein
LLRAPRSRELSDVGGGETLDLEDRRGGERVVVRALVDEEHGEHDDRGGEGADRPP